MLTLLLLPCVALSSPPDETAAPPLLRSEFEASTHMVSLQADIAPGVASYGIGWARAHEHGESVDGLGVMTWLGWGGSLRMVTRGHRGIDAVAAYGTMHLGMLACAGGSGLELGVGLGTDGSVPQALGLVGLFLGAYYFDLGWTHQFPLGPFERPDWLSGHSVGIRLHIPVARPHYSERTEWIDPETWEPVDPPDG